jgi:F0F1-type ATP synthase assembly protein I
MPSDEKDRERRSGPVGAFQDTVEKAGPAAAAGYTLIGAVLGLAAIGYAVDRWRGTFPWGTAIGLFVGMLVGFYELIKSTRRR